MNYKQNLFNVIKLLFLAIILVELATIKMIIMPSNLTEYIVIHSSINLYIEHILLSIALLSLGALIFLKRA